MSVRSPDTAPMRTDLPFLRRRSHPPGTVEAAQAVADFLHGAATHPHAGGQAGAVTDSASRAGGSDLLDLSTPAPARPVPAGPLPARAAPQKPSAPGPPVRRMGAGQDAILTPNAPTVTLTRVQSGVGSLTVEAACSPAIGDLRLGCAYQLTSGATSVVQHVTGLRTAPHQGSRPLLLAQRGQFEKLTADLVQVRDLERLAVYAFSESGRELAWGGTLVVTTLGGSRVEVPLVASPSSGVMVLLTAYQVDGELVLRAEVQEPAPSIQEACARFGYDRITWLDPRTPTD